MNFTSFARKSTKYIVLNSCQIYTVPKQSCLSIILLRSVIYKKFTRWKYVGQIFNLSFVFVFFRLYHPRQKGTEKNGPAVNKNNGRNSSRYFCGLERWVPAVPRHIWICHSWAANFGTATQFHYWQWNRFCHEWSSSITTQYVAKVQVFWAGHKNFTKSPNWFEFYLKYLNVKSNGRFLNFFCPSYKFWTVLI